MSPVDAVVLERCHAAQAKYHADWNALVSIDSPTCHGEGLQKVGHFVADRLGSLGAEVEIRAVANPDEGFNVLGTITGSGTRSILLLAHMDTVLPVGSAAERPFRVDQEGKANGPGVSDDKSGLVQCLFAMQILRDMEFGDFSKITLFANCQEENGSLSSREQIMELARTHDFVLCAEPGSPGDGVCVNRAGSGNLEIDVSGKTAHAAYPWLGCNAADELAHQILEVNKLADRDKGTVVTTRILDSGANNWDKSVVPDEAKAVLRVYAYLPEEIRRVESEAISLAESTLIEGARVRTRFHLAFPPFVKTQKVERLASLAQDVYAELGWKLELVSGAAATDAGWASSVNEAVLCSVGPVSGGKNHTDQEWADAKTVVPRLYMMTRMLMRLGSNGLQ